MPPTHRAITPSAETSNARHSATCEARRPSSLAAIAAAVAVALALLASSAARASTAPPSVGAGGGPAATGSVSGATGSPTGGCPGYCDDSNACTEDTCDDQYECHHTPIVCNDGLNCTVDSCNTLTGCVYAPRDCSTGNACLTMACLESTGTCVIVSKLICADNNACTTDTCDAEFGCRHAPVPCHDGDPCTRDVCDPAVGCTHIPGECRPPGHSTPPGAGGGGLVGLPSGRGGSEDRSGGEPTGTGTLFAESLREASRAVAAACGAESPSVPRRRAEAAIGRLLSAARLAGPGSDVSTAAAWDITARALAAAMGDDGVCR